MEFAGDVNTNMENMDMNENKDVNGDMRNESREKVDEDMNMKESDMSRALRRSNHAKTLKVFTTVARIISSLSSISNRIDKRVKHNRRTYS